LSRTDIAFPIISTQRR